VVELEGHGWRAGAVLGRVDVDLDRAIRVLHRDGAATPERQLAHEIGRRSLQLQGQAAVYDQFTGGVVPFAIPVRRAAEIPVGQVVAVLGEEALGGAGLGREAL